MDSIFGAQDVFRGPRMRIGWSDPGITTRGRIWAFLGTLRHSMRNGEIGRQAKWRAEKEGGSGRNNFFDFPKNYEK